MEKYFEPNEWEVLIMGFQLGYFVLFKKDSIKFKKINYC
jgi:hypothetical protein